MEKKNNNWFPDIPFIKPKTEPVKPNYNPNFSVNIPKFEPPKPTFPILNPDLVIDFNEKIDIKNDSINLALEVLGMSHSEYNSTTTESLKNMRMINSTNNYAINILIHYKKNESCRTLNLLKENTTFYEGQF